jgi:hypothetical protein
MGINKRQTVIAGVLIVGLLGSNTYAYMELHKAKDELKEAKVQVKKAHQLQEQLDVAVSQLMNKSTQYASHEDMIYAFNIYSASNRIHYNGADYYADLKHIYSHTFNEKEKTNYVVQAEMTFLKDKIVDGTSYIQNKLPLKLMEEAKKLAKEVNIHEGHDEQGIVIPPNDLVKIEKKAKEKFVVHKWNQKLRFNIKNQTIIHLSADTEESIMKEFVKAIVLKEKGIDGEQAEIKLKTSQSIQTIEVRVEGKIFTFTYNKDTKEFLEKK